MTKLLSAVGDLVFDQNETYRVREQVIGDDFKDHLELQRDHRTPFSNNMMVCSIPQALVDHWIASGFDFWGADPKTICDRLRREGYEHFITGS